MIHHKFRTAALVLALAGLALLGSCTRDEEAPQAVSSIRGIDFDAGEDAPGSLKASPATGSQLINFIVSAFWLDGDWDTGTSRLFDAQNVYKTEGGDWDYRPKKIWPSSGSVAFYAYAPAGSPNTDGLSGKGSFGDQVPEITYTVPDSPADQEDFMLAVKSYDTGDLSGAVSLRFRHVLSYVTVSVQNAYEENIRVSKLELRNIHKKGSLKLEEDGGTGAASKGIPAGETGFRYDDSGQEHVTLWTTTDNINHDAAANKIEFALEGDVAVAEGATVSLTGNTNGLFVLPQELEDDGDDDLDVGETYIHVEYATYSEPSVTLTENIRLDLAAFEAGRKYAVMLDLKASYDPDHDPAAVNVWAASNIYFKPDVVGGTVGSLTFAESGTGKEGYQGVFFKWGSLVGVSTNTTTTENTYHDDYTFLFIPDLNTGKYYKYSVGSVVADTDNIVNAYLDKARGNEYENIPYADENDIRGTLLTEVSDQDLYGSYKGDICKYLSDTKSANDSGLSRDWIMPVKEMFDEGVYDNNTWSNASFSGGITEDGTDITEDALLGYIYNLTEPVIFPATGGRATNGDLGQVGSMAIYWSSTGFYESDNAYGLTFGSYGDTVNYEGGGRQRGVSVRCVREVASKPEKP
jgi:hypothetical protein